MSKQITIGLLAGLVFLAAFVFVLNVPYVSAQNVERCETTQCRKDLAAARAGTAAYHDFQAAVDDDFVVPFPEPCFALPSGPAIGLHFIKQSRVDLELDPAAPELLIYLPDDNGEMRLVAVEYLVPGSPDDTPPELFGQQFHFAPIVSSWTLHAWIWRNNPDGIFADFNPKLRCPTP